MRLWSTGPDIDKLKDKRDVAGLLRAFDGGKPETCQRIVGALVAIMREGGYSAVAESNEQAAVALLRLGLGQELLSYYDEYKPPDDDRRARDYFVIRLTSLLGAHAALTGNRSLLKHLLLTGEFGFAELGSSPWGNSPLLVSLINTLESAGTAEELTEVWRHAQDVSARSLARDSLIRTGTIGAAIKTLSEAGGAERVIEELIAQIESSQPSVDISVLAYLVDAEDQRAIEFVRMISNNGVRGTLLKINRPEIVRLFEAQYLNDRGTVDKAALDRADQEIRKRIARILKPRLPAGR
jgi:hypothetical protein